MITSEATRIFVKYGGNADALDRMSSSYERTALSTAMLRDIEFLILRLALASARASSASYDSETEALLCPAHIDPEAVALLKQFVQNELPAKR